MVQQKRQWVGKGSIQGKHADASQTLEESSPIEKPYGDIQEAYDKFILHADQKKLRVIANVQYFHECLDGAKEEREKAKENHQLDHAGRDDNNRTEFDMDIDDAREIEEIQEGVFWEEITYDDIERARLMKTHARERLYGESAVSLGYDTGFFKETHQDITYTFTARKLQPDEGEKNQNMGNPTESYHPRANE